MESIAYPDLGMTAESLVGLHASRAGVRHQNGVTSDGTPGVARRDLETGMLPDRGVSVLAAEDSAQDHGHHRGAGEAKYGAPRPIQYDVA